MKNKGLRILQLVISGGVLFYVLKDVDFFILIHILENSDWTLILLTVVITNIGIILSSYKLKLLLNSHDFKGMIKLTYIGTFFNFCLPGTIGGDAARIGYSYICYADYATAQAFNPKIVMRRSKTLMQGDSYCNHRYEMEV